MRIPWMGTEFPISWCPEQVGTLTQNQFSLSRTTWNMMLLKNMGLPLDTPTHSENGFDAARRCRCSPTTFSSSVETPSLVPPSGSCVALSTRTSDVSGIGLLDRSWHMTRTWSWWWLGFPKSFFRCATNWATRDPSTIRTPLHLYRRP